MGILTRAFKRADSGDNGYWIELTDNLFQSNSGIFVNEEIALTASAVYACIKVLAESIASLPLHLYKRLDGGGKDKATGHPLYTLLHSAPCPELTAFNYKEIQVAHLANWGNSYSQIVRDGSERPVELWPLRPDKTKVERDTSTGEKIYVYTLPNGEKRALAQHQVFHIPGFGYDGIKGLSPVQMAAREAVGLALSLQEYGAKFFANGAMPGVVIKHPQTLDDEVHDRIRSDWERLHKGVSKSHRVAILEEGMEIEAIGIPNDAAQYLASRKFQIEEITRIHRVPPHLIQHLERATFSNIEHQGLEFVIHTLRPYLVRYEQNVSKQLLFPAERKVYLAEYLVDGLLRGDTLTRYQSYAMSMQNGWMNLDEIRELENKNPLPDGQGKKHFVPLNLVPLDDMGSDFDLDMGDDDGSNNNGRSGKGREQRARAVAGRKKMRKTYYNLYNKTAGRMLHKEIAAVRKAIDKLLPVSATNLHTWLEDFYKQKQPKYIYKDIAPLIHNYSDVIKSLSMKEAGYDGDEPDITRKVDGYTDTYVHRHIKSSLGQMLKILEESTGRRDDGQYRQLTDEEQEAARVAMHRRLDEWEDTRAGKIARDEVVRGSDAFAVFTWAAIGVMTLVWIASPGACEYCSQLDGQVVGIDAPFVQKGDVMNPGDSPDMHIKGAKFHPPLHRSCECIIGAG